MLVKRKIVSPPTGAIRRIYVGGGRFAIVDARDHPWLSRFYWHAKKSNYCVYATRKIIRNGKAKYIRMHNEIMKPAAGLHVHHKNRNTLDNRRCNLEILYPSDHQAKHRYRAK